MRTIAVLLFTIACGAEAAPAEQPAPMQAQPPSCQPPSDALVGEITDLWDKGNETPISFNVGADDGVAPGWIGAIDLRGRGTVCFAISGVKAHSSSAVIPAPAKVVKRSSLTVRVFRP